MRDVVDIADDYTNTYSSFFKSTTTVRTTTTPLQRQRPRRRRASPIAAFFGILLAFLVCFVKVDFVSAKKYVPPSEDPYKVLGVNKRDDMETIKKAYRAKAKENHPDKNPNLDPDVANENFRRIVDAFEFLSDPQKKRRYDQFPSRQSSSSSSHAFFRNANNQNRNNNNKRRFTFRQEPRSNNNNNNNNNNSNQGRQQKQQHFDENQKRRLKEMNKRKAEREAQREERKASQKARVMQEHVWRFNTIDELKDKMTTMSAKDSQYYYKKHLLLVFVGNKRAEQIVDDELHFPYPFGGPGPNGILWEDVLQTAKVRYNKATPLTKLFKVPTHKKDTPYFVVCQKGDAIDKFHASSKLAGSSSGVSQRKRLEHFVESKLLAIKVRVVNHHHASIRIYRYDSEQQTHKLGTLPPGQSAFADVKLVDRLRVLDGNMDNYPGSPEFSEELFANLGKAHIQKVLLVDALVATHDGNTNMRTGVETVIVVASKTCYDLSLQCYYWVERDSNRCEYQSEFMHNICKASCGVCSDIPIWNSIQYGLFHYPIHKLPLVIQPPTQFLRELSALRHPLFEDMDHVVKFRRNVVFVFFVGGVLVGWNILFLFLLMQAARHYLHKKDVVLVPLFVLLLGLTILFLDAKRSPFPALQSFHADLKHVLVRGREEYKDAISGLLIIGCLIWNLIAILWRWTFTTNNDDMHSRSGACDCMFRFFLSLLVLSLAGLVTLFMVVEAMAEDPRREYLWSHLLSMRKNAVAAIGFGGLLLGATVRAFCRVTTALTGYLVQSLVVNAVILGPVALVVWEDDFFQRDLTHVLKFRRTAASLFALVGLLVGSFLWTITPMFSSSPGSHGTTTSTMSSSWEEEESNQEEQETMHDVSSCPQ